MKNLRSTIFLAVKFVVLYKVILAGTVSLLAAASSDTFILNQYISANGYLKVVYIHDSLLYVGGNFTEVTDDLGTHRRKGCAAYDLSSGRVTPFTADVDRGIVGAITFADGVLYIGGTFSKINAVPRSKIAAVDPANGAVMTTFGTDNDRINGPVFALACSNNKLFVGGNFTQVNGSERSYLAALDGMTGLLDTSFNPAPRDSMDIDGKMTGGVWALEVNPDDHNIIIAGGNFQTVWDSQNSPFLVTFTTDGLPGPAFDGPSTSPICDLDCNGGRLYAGIGGFGNRVGAYDISSPDGYSELWKGFTVEGDVQAVTCSDSGFVYFSFHQGLIDTTDLYRCAVAEAKNGCLYDTFPAISSFIGVLTLDVGNGYIAAGGIFNDIGGSPHNYLAVFREPLYKDVVLPQQVELFSPSGGSIGVSRYPKMEWRFTAYAETFDLQVATDDRFRRCVAANSGINDLDSRVSGLQGNTRYYWRVRAGNRWGYGPWSEVSHFITEPDGDNIPVIVQPFDGTEQTKSFECIWQPMGEALGYSLQVSEDWDFTTVLINKSEIADTHMDIAGLACDTRYYVRVKAITAGGPSEWAVTSFTTIPAPPRKPTGLTPVDGTTQVPCNPGLMWNLTERTASYRVQLAADEQFIGTIIDTAGIIDSLVVIPCLAKETRYYWRVGAANPGGETWSTAMQFTTELPSPNSPVALLPLQGAAVTDSTIKIIWSGSGPQVKSYRIELSHDPSMTLPFASIMTNDTSYVLSGLGDATEIFWRVKAYNETGAGPYSTTAVFTTVFPPAPVFHYALGRFDAHHGIGSISYSIAEQGDVYIALLDLSGHLVWRSIRSYVTAGYHSERMLAPRLSAGTYVLSFKAGPYIKKVRVMVME